MIEKTHPAEDAVYLLSYPRSGSTWFRYCVEFITKRRTNNSSEEMMTWETNAGLPRLLYSTHQYDDPEYNLICRNVKNIILIRNYKEAIVSQMLNLMISAWELDSYVEGPGEGIDGFHHRGNITQEQVEKLFKNLTNATIQRKMKAFEYLFFRSKEHGVHTYFAKEKGLSYYERLKYEARRYYGILLINDFTSTNWPNRSLAIKYEEFILDPFSSLNKTIDYLGENFKEPLILSVKEMKDNLNDLMENFEYHKNSSLKRYKDQHLGLSTTKKATDIFYYSSHMNKEVLLEFDRIFQEIHNDFSPTTNYNEHLLCYKEKTNDNQKGVQR